MKRLIFILLLIPFVAQSQTLIADTTYYTIGGTGTQTTSYVKIVNYRNAATTSAATPTQIKDSILSLRTLLSAFLLKSDILTGTATTPATTGAQTVVMNKSAFTLTATGATTLNASGGIAGQRCTFIITTSGTTSRVITFGTNFRSIGTLSTGTVTAKVFSVNFICSDGILWAETSRTVAQ